MIRKFLDLSTSHLCPSTREWLDKQGLISAAVRSHDDVFPTLMMGRTPYGWFVHADETSPLEAPGPRMPEDLWACMARAVAEGCDYLLFDADGDELDGLPTFEDAEATVVAAPYHSSVH